MENITTMYCLRIFLPKANCVRTLTESHLTCGSDAGNDLALPDAGIPDFAFRLEMEKSGYAFSSLHPQTKATVNGKRFETASLKPGDRIEIGRAVLVFDCHVPVIANHEPASLGEGLRKLCQYVADERDLRSLVRKAMHILKEFFEGDEAFLITLDEGGRPLIFVGTTPDSGSSQLFSDSIVNQVLRSGEGLCLPNAMSDPRFSHSESVSSLRLRSVICAPITAGKKVSGLIYVGAKRPSVSFDETHLRDLQVYAMVTGCLIHHVGFIALQRTLLDQTQVPGQTHLIAGSAAMIRVREEAELVASGDISVLLTGETGTGKDLLAQLIHQRSRRRDRPFVVINCSTLRGELLASELFGHRKGAFTGAGKDHEGLFVSANGGTVFLDEIGEMDLPLQAMLLRILETGKVRPVGQVREVEVDVRLITATNRNLEEMVKAGTFRMDLYYRINQYHICLPPLRDRSGDIELLAQHFLEKARSMYPEKRLEGFLPESLFAMARYSWPGNIREMANVVARAALFSPGPAVKVHFPEQDGRWMDMDEATRRFQSEYLGKALVACGGDKDKTAAILGISRSTMYRYQSHLKNGDEAPVRD